MRFFYDDVCTQHAPPKFFRHGTIVDHPEMPIRAEILRKAVSDHGYELATVTDHGIEPLKAVHTPDYIDFLSGFWDRRGEIDINREEFIATQFPRLEMNRRPTGLQGQLGYYMADTSTSIMENTWDAIYATSQVALSAADEMLKNRTAYALCRPPGHHAFSGCAGGFCFLNNTAITARYLQQKLNKNIAILDIDVHHGNGTQGIFYGDNDVLTISLHANTTNYFPFYAGYADETGSGKGAGFNVNIPLDHGTGDQEFLVALKGAFAKIRDFNPGALVIALGLDAAENDPLGVLSITEGGFNTIGKLIAEEDYPTLLIQEGGYLTKELPDNLVAFLKGFNDAFRT